MSEQDAGRRIIVWAFQHFDAKMVEVLSIKYDEDEDVWEAELEVDTSADNPYVTFFEDSMYANGIQVKGVEY